MEINRDHEMVGYLGLNHRVLSKSDMMFGDTVTVWGMGTMEEFGAEG